MSQLLIEPALGNNEETPIQEQKAQLGHDMPSILQGSSGSTSSSSSSSRSSTSASSALHQSKLPDPSERTLRRLQWEYFPAASNQKANILQTILPCENWGSGGGETNVLNPQHPITYQLFAYALDYHKKNFDPLESKKKLGPDDTFERLLNSCVKYLVIDAVGKNLKICFEDVLNYLAPFLGKIAPDLTSVYRKSLENAMNEVFKAELEMRSPIMGDETYPEPDNQKFFHYFTQAPEAPEINLSLKYKSLLNNPDKKSKKALEKILQAEQLMNQAKEIWLDNDRSKTVDCPLKLKVAKDELITLQKKITTKLARYATDPTKKETLRFYIILNLQIGELIKDLSAHHRRERTGNFGRDSSLQMPDDWKLQLMQPKSTQKKSISGTLGKSLDKILQKTTVHQQPTPGLNLLENRQSSSTTPVSLSRTIT